MITIDATMSAYVPSRLGPRRRVDLLNASSGLSSRPRCEGETRMVNKPARGHDFACHSETRQFHELVENGPSATFVAQVLCQDQPSQHTSPDHRAQAYERASRAARTPQLLRVA